MDEPFAPNQFHCNRSNSNRWPNLNEAEVADKNVVRGADRNVAKPRHSRNRSSKLCDSRNSDHNNNHSEPIVVVVRNGRKRPNLNGLLDQRSNNHVASESRSQGMRRRDHSRMHNPRLNRKLSPRLSPKLNRSLTNLKVVQVRVPPGARAAARAKNRNTHNGNTDFFNPCSQFPSSNYLTCDKNTPASNSPNPDQTQKGGPSCNQIDVHSSAASALLLSLPV